MWWNFQVLFLRLSATLQSQGLFYKMAAHYWKAMILTGLSGHKWIIGLEGSCTWQWWKPHAAKKERKESSAFLNSLLFSLLFWADSSFLSALSRRPAITSVLQLLIQKLSGPSSFSPFHNSSFPWLWSGVEATSLFHLAIPSGKGKESRICVCTHWAVRQHKKSKEFFNWSKTCFGLN